jgi:hypothetical protein
MEGMTALSLFQLSDLTLYVELVTCSTPSEAISLTSRSGSSFTNGMMGSILTVTGTLFWTSSLTAFKRSEGEGTRGSIAFATSSLSVVMVKATIDGTFFNKSMSLTTRLDLVTI